MKESLSERFWKKVAKNAFCCDCWEWTGSRQPNGYGQIQVNGRPKLTHRLSYELNTGPIPKGISVLHRCDNRRCVRPDHLFLGTAKDNACDMAMKGRSTKGRRRPGSGPAGERNSHAVIGPSIVALIRSEVDGSVRKIAAKYGISKSQVHNIVSRKQWGHL
jgi:hypothetical protein